jgi:hypothetical protein
MRLHLRRQSGYQRWEVQTEIVVCHGLARICLECYMTRSFLLTSVELIRNRFHPARLLGERTY